MKGAPKLRARLRGRFKVTGRMLFGVCSRGYGYVVGVTGRMLFGV